MSENESAEEHVTRLNYRNIFLLLLGILVILSIANVISPVAIYNTVLFRPMLNFLVLTSKYLFGSMGLAIIILTILVRLLMMPASMKQLRSSTGMRAIQPKLQELQKKYAKDKERLSQETMKLYKEHGVNPLGCVLPLLFQLPLWIALYQSVIEGLAYAPENMIGLSKQLYSWSVIHSQIPLNEYFLWLDLRNGDIFMAILVAGSMWMLQKMSQSPSDAPSQQQIGRLTLWIMPLIFGFLALTFPSGLSIFWILSNIIGMLAQYRVSGWGGLRLPSRAAIKRIPHGFYSGRNNTVAPSGNVKKRIVRAGSPGTQGMNKDSQLDESDTGHANDSKPDPGKVRRRKDAHDT